MITAITEPVTARFDWTDSGGVVFGVGDGDVGLIVVGFGVGEFVDVGGVAVAVGLAVWVGFVLDVVGVVWVGVGEGVAVEVGSEVTVEAMFAVITPGPSISAVVAVEVASLKVIAPVLLVQCVSWYPALGDAEIARGPASTHMLLVLGVVEALPVGKVETEI